MTDLRTTKLDAAVPVRPDDAQPLGTMAPDGLVLDDPVRDNTGLIQPGRPRSTSFEVTFTNVDPRLARLLFYGDKKAPRIPLFFPHMKYRARRRHLGYTRTGRRR